VKLDKLITRNNEGLRGRVRRSKSALGFFVPRKGRINPEEEGKQAANGGLLEGLGGEKILGWKHPLFIEN
jgi:hypothetical protein